MKITVDLNELQSQSEGSWKTVVLPEGTSKVSAAMEETDESLLNTNDVANPFTGTQTALFGASVMDQDTYSDDGSVDTQPVEDDPDETEDEAPLERDPVPTPAVREVAAPAEIVVPQKVADVVAEANEDAASVATEAAEEDDIRTNGSSSSTSDAESEEESGAETIQEAKQAPESRPVPVAVAPKQPTARPRKKKPATVASLIAAGGSKPKPKKKKKLGRPKGSKTKVRVANVVVVEEAPEPEVLTKSGRRKKPLKRYNPELEASKPQLMKGSSTKKKRQRKAVPVATVAVPVDLESGFLQPGTKVKAQWDSGTRWYNAHVKQRNEDDGTYSLQYKDGGWWERVPVNKIRVICDESNPKLVKKATVSTPKPTPSQSKRRVLSGEAPRALKLSFPVDKDGKVARCEHQFRGLTWSEQKQRWMARIYHNNNTTHLGTFDNPVDAARAYDIAAREMEGKKLNFPRDMDLETVKFRIEEDVSQKVKADTKPKSKQQTKEKVAAKSPVKKQVSKSLVKRKAESKSPQMQTPSKRPAVKSVSSSKDQPKTQLSTSKVAGVSKKSPAKPKSKSPKKSPVVQEPKVHIPRETMEWSGARSRRRPVKREIYDPTAEARRPQWGSSPKTSKS